MMWVKRVRYPGIMEQLYALFMPYYEPHIRAQMKAMAEYYMKKHESTLEEVFQDAILYGAGYASMGWDEEDTVCFTRLDPVDLVIHHPVIPAVNLLPVAVTDS